LTGKTAGVGRYCGTCLELRKKRREREGAKKDAKEEVETRIPKPE
jgi:hypothetical protein